MLKNLGILTALLLTVAPAWADLPSAQIARCQKIAVKSAMAVCQHSLKKGWITKFVDAEYLGSSERDGRQILPFNVSLEICNHGCGGRGYQVITEATSESSCRVLRVELTMEE